MIYTIRNKIFPSNTYLVNIEGSNNCLLIDPGLDQEAIECTLNELQLEPTHILATHGHFDHVGSVSYFQKKYHVKFYIHELDVKILKSINFYLKIMKIEIRVGIPVPDHIIYGAKQTLHFNNSSIAVYNLPGHTDGSCLFHINDCLFTGDTLYSNGIGFNPFPGQDKVELKHSLKKIIELFSDDTMIYPGHGTSENLRDVKSGNNELALFLETN